MQIQHVPGHHPDIPSTLPTEAIADVVGCKAQRIASLVLRVHQPAALREQTIKRTGEKKNVTNVTMKGRDKKIEL